MKIILHMGQGKTGTTSLQQSLHEASGNLRGRKVLYPHFGGNAVAHHLLLALFGDPARLSPWSLQKLGGIEAAKLEARAAWDAVCEEVHRSRPELLILSSEFLVHQADGKAKARLAEALFKLSDNITPIIYIRHPVDAYRARLQERLKAGNMPLPALRTDLRTAVLDTEAAFGRSPELVAFDRRTLLGGDITCDFVGRFLAPLVEVNDLPTKAANAGLSAEALVLMVRLREEGGNTDKAAQRVARLTRRLAELDRIDPPSQPLALLPEVAEAVLRVATDYLWLTETGRLQIPGLDPDKIDGTPIPDWITSAPPETLFGHDPARLERLRKAITQVDLDTEPKKSPKPSSRAQQNKKKLGPVEFLLRFVRRKLASLQDRKTGAAPTRGNALRRSSQGDRNEDHETAGNLDTGARDRP